MTCSLRAGAVTLAISERFRYDRFMDKDPAIQAAEPEMLTAEQVEVARERRLEAMRLQEIEGNPFDAEDIAMFEMFERERWSHERRRAYILARARQYAAPQAAE